MNYIKQLQSELKLAQNKVNAFERVMDVFKGYLHGSKFAGVESDGGRKDWISTGDVLHWMRDVRSEINNVENTPVILNNTENQQ